MSGNGWISRGLIRLFPVGRRNFELVPDGVSGTVSLEKERQTPVVEPAARSTRERLAASIRHRDEALSPRMLRRILEELRAVIDPQISEVEGGRRAKVLAQWYLGATVPRRRDMWLLMSEFFMADPEKVRLAQLEFSAAVGTPDEAAAEVRYRRATVSPRRRLLQRFSVLPEGIRFLVDVRAEMLGDLRTDKRLQALDVEMEYMFSTWFDVGFLELRRISWDSPASLVEKLIKYEAVHDIRSWADVKNRLDSDRRCYGFFHPRLPQEPLIFVEVALVDAIAQCISPLLDELAAPSDLKRATTAIFYSISNTQTGLRGVSFGDSLIKRVVETLSEEFPKLKVFATLSPIPGFRKWLRQHVGAMLQKVTDGERAELGRALGQTEPNPERLIDVLESMREHDGAVALMRFLRQAAAFYLAHGWHAGKPIDPVARFHLGNGALIYRLNWAADPSAKGWQQSYGMMVNYLYDLKRLDKNRNQLLQGKIAVSSSIEDLRF